MNFCPIKFSGCYLKGVLLMQGQESLYKARNPTLGLQFRFPRADRLFWNSHEEAEHALDGPALLLTACNLQTEMLVCTANVKLTDMLLLDMCMCTQGKWMQLATFKQLSCMKSNPRQAVPHE